MRKFFPLVVILLVFGSAHAQNAESKTDESKLIQSKEIQAESNSHSVRTMKIQSDEKGDEAKRKAFIDELRSLYKINFL